MKLRALIIFTILIVIGVVVVHHQPKKIEQPCTKQACIEIKQTDGSSYKLNDFRFLSGHCIKFVSLPDNVDRHYCGDYKLNWIGPVPKQPPAVSS